MHIYRFHIQIILSWKISDKEITETTCTLLYNILGLNYKKIKLIICALNFSYLIWKFKKCIFVVWESTIVQ